MRFLFVIGLSLVGAAALAQYQGHGTSSVSDDVLKKYAPPALDAVMTNKLKKMFDVSAPGMGILSPDHKTLYFTWRVTGQAQLWKIDGPQKFPTQLTSGSDAVTLQDIAPNGKFLILSKDVNGEENPGLFRLWLEPKKLGQIEQLYRKPKVQARFDFLTTDSKYMYFTANDRKEDSYSVYKMDLQTEEIQTVYEGDGIWAVADQLNNGEQLLLTKYSGARINEYYLFETKTKKLEPVIGQNSKEEYEVQFAAQKGKYLVLTAKDNFKRLYLYDGKNFKTLSSEKLNFDVSSFSIDEKKQRVTYTVNRDGYTTLYALNAQTFASLKLPQFKGADHIFSGKTTRDGQVTMLGIISAKSPRVSYSYNWSSGQLQQWVLPSAPEVNLNSFSVSELMNYEARDKTKIPMFVRYPEGCKESKNCPVVVHFHGGPEGQSTPGFNPIAQAFVNEGFIFVEPNVRGSEGYGKEWLDSDNGPKRESVVTDIEDASLWIRQNWKTDKGEEPKVGVMGWSYGGYSTLMAMTRFAGAFDAGVALVGMSNLVTFIQNTAPYRRILRMSEYGDPDKDKEAMLKLSPVTYLDKVKSPLLIIQGANDPRVPVGEALQIQEKLSGRKIKSDLIIFADEGHGSSKKDNQVLEIGHTINFFKKHLIGR